MSAPGHETARESATETDLQAADWLQRQQFWNWSETDQSALDAWLSQSRAHRIAYWRQKAVWNNAQRLVALRPAQAARETAANGSSLSRFANHPLRWAAAFAFVAVIGASAAHFLTATHDRIYSTPLGGHETIRFADGTKVELNTNTVLRARMTTTSRTVWLERGEAYFQVKHDAAHPFAVIAAGHRITDMGTKFDVRRDLSGLQVALLEGKVRIGSADGAAAHAALMRPGDVAMASGNQVAITTKPMQSLNDELSWRKGVLVFKYRTLADVAAEFNRYNTKKIVIADEDTGRLMIFGTFRTEDIDLFTRVTQRALGLTVKDEEDQIVISR
mgnify:FL=1